jgi:16S rRNA G966 N2-methylase RsmD
MSYRLARVYEEDARLMREQAPDRRSFLLGNSAGEVRSVKGYRGDGSPLGRRGLPVCDARLLVNLVFAPPVFAPDVGKQTFLDPFAGAGGIVLEALSAGYAVVSLDIDPGLCRGLAAFGASHSVANASRLPLQAESFAAVGTEPPYDRAAEGAILASLGEIARVLKKGGKAAMLCAEWQAEKIRPRIQEAGFTVYLDSPVDRKGTPVVVLAMQKGYTQETSRRYQFREPEGG